MTLKENLIKKAETFCAEAGCELSTLGRESINDGKVFTRLKSGGDLTTKNYERISQYIEDNSITPEASHG